MRLTIENCKCGGYGCAGKLIYLDGDLLDGIHSADIAITLQTAVNLHDELVAALRACGPVLKAFRPMADDGSTLDDVLKQVQSVLAKLEKKGE